MDDVMKYVLIAAGLAVVGTVGYLGYKEFFGENSGDRPDQAKPNDNADLAGDTAKAPAVSDAEPALTI